MAITISDTYTNCSQETHLSVPHRRLQQLLEILISLLVLVPRLAPLRNGLAVENQNMEEGIEKKDDVRLDRDAIQQDRLGWNVKCIRHQRWLDHCQRVIDVLSIEHVSAAAARGSGSR